MTTTPRAWAENATFVGGALAGNTVKIDAGSGITGNGFYPNVAFGAQNVNSQLSLMSRANRHAIMLAALQLRRLDGVAMDDTAVSLGVIRRAARFDTILCKVHSGGVPLVSDGSCFGLGGVLASFTSLCTDVARGSVYMAIGTGGNGACTSSNEGGTWTAVSPGLSGIGVRGRIVFDASSGNFIVAAPGIGSVFRTTTGATWASTASGFAAPDGLAVLTGGVVAVLGDNGSNQPRVARSINGGATFDTPTAVSATTYAESGCIVGNGGATIYHVGRTNTNHLVVNSSTDGSAWTVRGVLDAANGATHNARPRIMQCANTGGLWVVAASDSGQMTLYYSADGIDWLGPLLTSPTQSVDGYGVAGGRLFASRDAMLFASDGVFNL